MSDSQNSFSSSLDSSSGNLIIAKPLNEKKINKTPLQGNIPYSAPPVSSIPKAISKAPLPSILGKNPSAKKIQDSEDGFSSIDSKPSVRAKPKIEAFDFNVAIKPASPPKLPERQLSIKYEAKIIDSFSSSSSSSLASSSSSFKDVEIKEKNSQIVHLQPSNNLKQTGEKKRESSSSSSEDSNVISPKNNQKALMADVKLQINPNDSKSGHIDVEGIKIKGPGELKNQIVDFNHDDAYSLDKSNSSSFISESKDEIDDDLFVKAPPKHPDKQSDEKRNKEPENSKSVLKKEPSNPKINENSRFDSKELGVRFEENPGKSNESKYKLIDKEEVKSSQDNDHLRDIEIFVDNRLIESMTNRFLFSAQSLSLGQLLKSLNELNHVSENYWNNKGCMTAFCKCFRTSNRIPLSKQARLFKLIKLGQAKYDNINEYHRNIMMSYYMRYTMKAQFEDTPQTWSDLGFINQNPAKNELSEPCILLTILHMVYLFENKVQISRKLLSMKKDSNISTMRILQTLMKNSLELLREQVLNDLIRSEPSSDEITLFFEFHSGAMFVWIDIFSIGKLEESYKETFNRVRKNPKLYWNIFKNLS